MKTMKAVLNGPHKIGDDGRIYAGVRRIRWDVLADDDVLLGDRITLENCILEAGVVIGTGASVINAHLGEGVTIPMGMHVNIDVANTPLHVKVEGIDLYFAGEYVMICGNGGFTNPPWAAWQKTAFGESVKMPAVIRAWWREYANSYITGATYGCSQPMAA